MGAAMKVTVVPAREAEAVQVVAMLAVALEAATATSASMGAPLRQ